MLQVSAAAPLETEALLYKIDRKRYWNAEANDAEITVAAGHVFRGVPSDGTPKEFSFWSIADSASLLAVAAELDRCRGGHAEQLPYLAFTLAELKQCGVMATPDPEGTCLLARPHHLSVHLTFEQCVALLQLLKSCRREICVVATAQVKAALKAQDDVGCLWISSKCSHAQCM